MNGCTFIGQKKMNKPTKMLLSFVLLALLVVLASPACFGAEKETKSQKIAENHRVHFYLNRAWLEGDSDHEKVSNYFHHRGFKLLKSVMVGNEKVYKYYVYIISKTTKKTKYAVVIFDNPWYGAPAGLCMESPTPGTIKEDTYGTGCTPLGGMRYYVPKYQKGL